MFSGAGAPIGADEILFFQRGEDVIELSGFADLDSFDDLDDLVSNVDGPFGGFPDTVLDLSEAFGSAPGTDTITISSFSGGQLGLDPSNVVFSDGATA